MTTITVHSIAVYLQMNDKRRNTPAILSNGNWSYLVDGQRISEEDFEQRCPKAEYKIPGNIYGDNPNRKANFINNTKSY